mgnify:FL=1
MLLPESWLREWVDTNLSIKEIANILTMIGLEVEHIGSVGPDFSKVVIGRICGIKDHPNADKLRICEVDVGEYQKLTIICGAPNVELNMFVACALVGAILPGNYKIKRAKIRGIESQGMLCSAAELGLEDTSEGIVELQNFGNSDLGTEYRKTFGFDEIVLTVKPTPNRGDCLSVLGVARDLCAALLL